MAIEHVVRRGEHPLHGLAQRLLVAAASPSVGGGLNRRSPNSERDSNGARPSRFGEVHVQRWVAGVIVRATGGSCTGIRAYIPIPTDWPEQDVPRSRKTFPRVKVSYRMVEGGVRQMVVEIPFLAAGEEASFDHHGNRAPSDSTSARYFGLRPSRTAKAATRRASLPSRQSWNRGDQFEDSVALKATFVGRVGTAWEKVERIYDWVRDNIKYQEGPFKGALAALSDGTGDCEEMTSLFIALCRAGGIPARTVWIPGHAYAEFYLMDKEGKGYWFPCQLAGSRAFGEMNELAPFCKKATISARPRIREIGNGTWPKS